MSTKWNDVPELPPGDVYFGGTDECCPRCESKDIKQGTVGSVWEIDGFYCEECHYAWAPLRADPQALKTLHM